MLTTAAICRCFTLFWIIVPSKYFVPAYQEKKVSILFFHDLWIICEFYSLQLIASGFAVATYNEGATDFKQTPAYKESIQSRDLLEEPEGSSSDVFESNPTEEAPSLE